MPAAHNTPASMPRAPVHTDEFHGPRTGWRERSGLCLRAADPLHAFVRLNTSVQRCLGA